jgi:hypothetical protein
MYGIESLEDRIVRDVWKIVRDVWKNVRDVWKITGGLILDASSALTWIYSGTRQQKHIQIWSYCYILTDDGYLHMMWSVQMLQ